MAFSLIPHTRISILGSRFTYLPRSEVALQVINIAHQQHAGYVCVSNVHTTMTGFWDRDYQAIQNASTFTVPDGVPIVWAMNLLRPAKMPPQDRVRGPSLMPEVCAKGVSLGLRHYLFGGTPAALQALEAHLKNTYPGIIIAGSASPSFRLFWTEEEIEAAVKQMKESGAHIVWVGLGAPKQERWMGAASKYHPPFLMGIGAAFDLLPGRIPEAPAWMQSRGLEWLYRLIKEPRRLWRRYLFYNPAFMILFTMQWLGSVLFRQSYLCESSARE